MQLLHRHLDRLHRQYRGAEQPLGIRLAVIGEPAIVGAACGCRALRVFYRAEEKPKARIQEGRVDSVGVHVGDTRVWVKAAAPAFGVGYALGIDSSRACADRAESAEPNFLLAAAEVEGVVAFDLEDFAASFGNDQFGTIVAKSRVTVTFPQVRWFMNVTVCVDDVIFHCVHLARFVRNFAGLSAFRYGNYDIDMR